ncbi:MAG: phosphoribosyl-AMP cyclohydrolase [Spirochaetaceae bacterium]|nr:MAG: phosphoribosyl-AMP cyclohydrolase [Spirochaetaceae bacterium]
MDKNSDTEERMVFRPRFGPDGLIPVVTVDAQSGEVLMHAYMNSEALDLTIDRGEAVYYSRSRARLWKKGETSGFTQKVNEILVDCDQDTLVLRVSVTGGATCHTGRRSCFYRRVVKHADAVELEPTNVPVVFDPAAVYGTPDTDRHKQSGRETPK